MIESAIRARYCAVRSRVSCIQTAIPFLRRLQDFPFSNIWLLDAVFVVVGDAVRDGPGHFDRVLMGGAWGLGGLPAGGPLQQMTQVICHL